MGSKYIFERNTSAPLFNCGFVSTEGIDVDFSGPFCWAMDMLMLGVGVGFDARGKTKDVVLRAPKMANDTHVVTDDREGWVQLIKRILDSYVGKDTLPERIDYSKIRKAGRPIKGFGGTSSGSKPLKSLVNKLTAELNKYLKDDYLVDSTLIVDLMNFIGECVVSGNVRRSAEIALSDINDEEFIPLITPF